MRFVLVRILDLQDMIEDVAFNVTTHDISTELLQLYTGLQDVEVLGPDLSDKFQLMISWSELMSNSGQHSERLNYYTKLLSQLTQIEIKVRMSLCQGVTATNPFIHYSLKDHSRNDTLKTG